MLVLLIIATAVIFILSRTYSDDESKDDEASETEEEADANNSPETGIPQDALRADLLDAGIACNHMDRGLLVNAFVVGTLQATDQPVNAFNKNDHKALTDAFKGPAFVCEDVENTDISSFRLTPDDFKVAQEIIVGAVFEQDPEFAELTRQACAPTGAQETLQFIEEGLHDSFDDSLAIEDWVFMSIDDLPALENQLTEAGIQTKDIEPVDVCNILLN